MLYRKGLLLYLLICILAILFLQLPILARYIGFHTSTYMECNDLCFIANVVVVWAHIVFVSVNAAGIVGWHQIITKDRKQGSPVFTRILAIKLTSVVVCFVLNITVESEFLLSPYKFWVASVLLGRVHFGVEIFATLSFLGILYFAHQKEMRNVYRHRITVGASVDMGSMLEHFEFLAPPRGQEIARIGPLNPTERESFGDGMDEILDYLYYLQTSTEEHHKRYPLITFRPPLELLPFPLPK
ncbi:hypothetical protein B9Z55_024221 [Caenorhabditis nigoni]|nr:hypothetical protein B9Z55_024221 [Caenorhabditis nigoni]